MRVVADALLGIGLVSLVFSLLAVWSWIDPRKEDLERQKAGARALGDLWSAVVFCGLAAAVRFWPW